MVWEVIEKVIYKKKSRRNLRHKTEITINDNDIARTERAVSNRTKSCELAASRNNFDMSTTVNKDNKLESKVQVRVHGAEKYVLNICPRFSSVIT